MKKIVKKLIQLEGGNTIIIVSLSMMMLLCMAGLVLDGGALFVTRSHLQKTANAAVLSGAQKLLNGEEDVKEVLQEVLTFHKEENSIKTITINDSDLVRLELKKDIKLSFSSLLGMEKAPVEANAAAEIGVMGGAKGAVPLGIDKRFNPELYKEYELKTDTQGSDTGWFGILSLGGNGADTYYENFMNGYDNYLAINDVVETETGNVAGKTRLGVKNRIDGCPYPFETAIDKKCSRIILIPVYEPYDVRSNQIKKVKIVGFAYFYLTKMPQGNETSVYGMFIEAAGTGTINPDALNRGAYSIRLTE